jgi:hypothetical protein
MHLFSAKVGLASVYRNWLAGTSIAGLWTGETAGRTRVKCLRSHIALGKPKSAAFLGAFDRFAAEP